MIDRSDQNMRPFLVDLERLVDELKDRLPCCPNCTHWDSRNEVCALTMPRVRPPAPVIAFGCWAFEQDVPF